MKHTKGFTLIELLVVVAVIGILSTVIVASLSDARTRANDALVLVTTANFRSTAATEFTNDYTPLCGNPAFDEFVDSIELRGATLEDC